MVVFDSPPVHAAQDYLADLDGFSRSRRSAVEPVPGADSSFACFSFIGLSGPM